MQTKLQKLFIFVIIIFIGKTINSQELYLDNNKILHKIDSINNNFEEGKRYTELLKLMNLYRHSGEYISTIIIINNIKKTYKLDERKRTFAGLNTYLGQAYNGLGLYSESIKKVTKSQIYAKKNNDIEILISSLMISSEAYDKLNIKDKSEHLMFEAFNIVDTINNKNFKKLVLNNLTSTLLSANKLDSAMVYLNKLESLEKKDSITSYVHLNKCSCLFKQKKLDSAIIYCNLFREELKYFKNAHSKMALEQLFSEIYLKKKKLKKSINYAKASLDIALKYRYKKDAVDIYKLFSDIYQDNNSFLSSVYKQKSNVLKDSLTISNMRNALDNINLLHKIEKKSSDIINLELENKLKVNKIKTLIFILTTVIIVLVIIISQKRKINNAYRMIVKDNIKSLNDHEEIIKLRHKIEVKNIQVKTENKIIITDKQSDNIELKIRQLFDIDKIFLQNNIDLDKLATIINTNRVYLSHVFNNIIELSFNEMLNKYRINESKKLLLLNSKKYTIEAVALESGYKNKTTFNRNFKKITGVTPSFFIKTTQENEIS